MLHISSPHITNNNNSSKIMLLVVLSLVPALFVHIYFYGYGLVTNVVLAVICCLLFEAIALLCRRRNPLPALSDNSALVTAVLLAFSLPPLSPIWLIAIGCGVAIFIGKHLYGGLGQNCFNPAMLGYAFLLISFPLQMSLWTTATAISGINLSLVESLQIALQISDLADGITSATALDIYRQSRGILEQDIIDSNAILILSDYAVYGLEWFNLAILAGGVILIILKVSHWQAPFGMLVALIICANTGADNGSSSGYGSVAMHLLSGATMLTAFYIITDPVSAPVSNWGRFYAGIFVGFMIYIIRAFGNYPDGAAFAILLMNFAAPMLDLFTKPKVYGK